MELRASGWSDTTGLSLYLSLSLRCHNSASLKALYIYLSIYLSLPYILSSSSVIVVVVVVAVIVLLFLLFPFLFHRTETIALVATLLENIEFNASY